MASLVIPKKILSEIDEAIDSENINKAYESVHCSNPEHDPTPLLLGREIGCKECWMLGIKYQGADGHLAQYPKCILREYISERKELKNKIMGERQ